MPRSSARALLGRKKTDRERRPRGAGTPTSDPTDHGIFRGTTLRSDRRYSKKFSYLVYDNEMLGIFSPVILGVNYRLANLEGF